MTAVDPALATAHALLAHPDVLDDRQAAQLGRLVALHAALFTLLWHEHARDVADRLAPATPAPRNNRDLLEALQRSPLVPLPARLADALWGLNVQRNAILHANRLDRGRLSARRRALAAAVREWLAARQAARARWRALRQGRQPPARSSA